MRYLLPLTLALSLAGNVAMAAHAQLQRTVASPHVLSVRLLNEDEAWDLWAESRSMGENTCLTELNDGGLRYWLHSCPVPAFENAPWQERELEANR